MRRVAEEVRAAFPRPLQAPQLVLIDVDPRHVHAFWTLSAAAVDAARGELGDGGRDAAMVLRITETALDGDGPAFDIEVVGLQGQCYVDIWGEARNYRGDLALRRGDGSLRPLAGPAPVELPRSGPVEEAAPAPAPADAVPAPAVNAAPLPAATAAPLPAENAAPFPALAAAAEPVRHPFPLPPTEPGVYDATVLPGVLPGTLPGTLPGAPPVGLPPLPKEAAAPPAADMPAPPVPSFQALPEPVAHPFPLPPTEPGEYVPEGLIGGFVPADAPPPPEASPPPAAEAAPGASGGKTSGDGAGGAPAGDGAGGAPAGALPLENVLTLSSFALGRESVEFEINAELHIFGRARPGTQLQLFGRPVALRPDGTFSITRPLPNGALVLSSLLVGDGSDRSE
ncbi:MAG TPA: DUF4912 domain-containing protein [Rhodospirillales bacterium]|nr:DUF4912 domain-containing protein [Rhodospirillales bacterium]